jgi:transcriptional regulator with XRE-family HTH domain
MAIEEKIGEKIRQFRKARHLTIQQLSKVTNISESQLSRIETAKTSAPISTLDVIVKALGTTLGVLFDEGKTEENPRIVITKRDQRIPVRKGLMQFGYNYEALAASKDGKLMEPFVLRVRTGRRGESLIFNHPGEELIFVLQGEMLFVYEEDRYNLEKGDSVYFDAIGSHTVKNVGDVDLEFVVVICAIG